MEIFLGARPLNPAQKQALNEALNLAIQTKDTDMMVNAVDSGADPNILLFKGIQNKQLGWVQSAVEHGADVNATMSGVSYGQVMQAYNPYPVFFWLARYMDPDIGDYLLSKGAKIDAVSRDGDTALMAAVKMQDQTAVKYLVGQGADPLMICADKKFPLKELEDDTNWYDSSKKIPLIKAMMENLKKAGSAAEPAAAPANDANAAASTQQDIEVNRPLELKRKPRQGFEL
ncbi:MAG: ankyrin repeat domain-containing protein [Alphaproteobacteria bacterium]|nr:MAG: ankyrin repeat domain-containing protein [Alphaproteobacteria bacterium]